MQGDTTERTISRGGTGSGVVDLAIQWLRGTHYGELQLLGGARQRIGRGSASQLRLEHATVSREHAELYRQGPIYALKDCGSTNGTYLNGERIEHSAIGPGSVIRIGEFVGVVVEVPRSTEVASFGELAAGLIGGPTLAARMAEVKAAARTDVPVMIIGDTGTGKERVARAIHEWSGRAGRFHALNCSALPDGLAEAELFGHERGAFTGAERSRIGHLRAAHRGTLFLDEAAELPLAIQAKLLRAIEEREVLPLGATEVVAIDVRIVAAAREPFESYVAAKSFREDLYERLAGFHVTVPRLRDRREEIPALFRHLMTKHGAGRQPEVDAGFIEHLLLHPWRGNVRELELFVRKLQALRPGACVLERDAAQTILSSPAPSEHPKSAVTGARDRKEHDRILLRQALDLHSGNMTAAAASIGISRRRAYRLLDENGASASPALPELERRSDEP
jgi:DNA-binding NtrC family response regulator